MLVISKRGLFVLSLLLLTSCVRRFDVSVERPPEVDISRVQHLIIGDLRGDGAKDIQHDLNNALRANSMILFPEVVRSTLEQRGLTEDVSIDQTLLPFLQQTYANSALLIGQVDTYKFNQEIQTRQELDYDELGILRTYYLTKRHVWVDVEATFQLLDCQSGRVVAIRVAKSKVEASTDETRYLQSEVLLPPTPPQIDERELFAKARQQVASAAVHAISPHVLTEKVSLYTFPSIPELSQGIDLAKAGKWRESTAIFLLSTKEHPDNYRTFHNLAVAYKYSDQPRKALAAFQRANQLKPSKQYEEEIKACRQVLFDAN